MLVHFVKSVHQAVFLAVILLSLGLPIDGFSNGLSEYATWRIATAPPTLDGTDASMNTCTGSSNSAPASISLNVLGSNRNNVIEMQHGEVEQDATSSETTAGGTFSHKRQRRKQRMMQRNNRRQIRRQTRRVANLRDRIQRRQAASATLELENDGENSQAWRRQIFARRRNVLPDDISDKKMDQIEGDLRRNRRRPRALRPRRPRFLGGLGSRRRPRRATTIKRPSLDSTFALREKDTSFGVVDLNELDSRKDQSDASGDNNADNYSSSEGRLDPFGLASVVDGSPSDDNNEDLIGENSDGGRRVTFSATHEDARVLDLDQKGKQLLTAYMSQPVERYSLLSFHDEVSSDAVSNANEKARHWIVRRLDDDEAAPYQDNDTTKDDSNTDSDAANQVENNFFRLAVPLMPLVGIDLTPVVDVEVLSNLTVPSLDGEDAQENERKQQGRRWGPKRWRRRRQKEDEIRIRSVRVALLSTDDEVQEAMNNDDKRRRGARGRGKNGGGRGALSATPPGNSSGSDDNSSVQKMGYEAIGMVGQLQEWLKPFLSFDASIGWVEGGEGNGEKSQIRVKATVSTSLTIPELPLPLPSRLIVKRVGYIISSRVLKLAIPRFLRQLEEDFRRWASVDDERS